MCGSSLEDSPWKSDLKIIYFSTVCKAVSAINITILMALKRVTRPLNMSEKKFIMPLEIVLDGFRKDNQLGRNKLLGEMYIHECLCMKGLGKEATGHGHSIADWELVKLYSLL